MHEIGTRADGDQTSQRPIVYEARVIAADEQRSKYATDHRHE